MGANEATPADAAHGAGATTGATAETVQWATAAVALAPTRAGGYEDTPVGRLPTGPAGDAALAAAAAAGGGPASGAPPSARGGRRAVALRPALAPAAGALAAAAVAAIVRARRRRRRRIPRFLR